MAPSPTIRRLLKETSELSAASKNPNPAFHAAPVSDNDLHEWHFTLLGPPAPSPYAGGLYHGRISLPPSYPLKPPNFRFLTPSGRFEVNREICLSISGFHEETWMPAWGVRTALTALRSFMAESGTAGQVGGLESPKEVRERLAKESRGWRCAQCGARTNEEVMKDWWESCAQRGVQVGEDIGLEVLPDGLSLEAKIPGGKSENKAISRQEAGKERESDGNPRTSPHEADHNMGHQKQNSIGIKDGATPIHPATTLPSQSPGQGTRALFPASGPALSPTSPSTDFPSDVSIAGSSAPALSPTSTSTDFASIAATAGSSTASQRHNHQSNNSISSTTSRSAIQPAQTRHQPPPTTVSSRPRTTQQEEDSKSVMIDRAIYAVLFALFIMTMKKIFYPANRGSDWEDFSMVKE